MSNILFVAAAALTFFGCTGLTLIAISLLRERKRNFRRRRAEFFRLVIVHQGRTMIEMDSSAIADSARLEGGTMRIPLGQTQVYLLANFYP